jgi:hypothetical protein
MSKEKTAGNQELKEPQESAKSKEHSRNSIINDNKSEISEVSFNTEVKVFGDGKRKLTLNSKNSVSEPKRIQLSIEKNNSKLENKYKIANNLTNKDLKIDKKLDLQDKRWKLTGNKHSTPNNSSPKNTEQIENLVKASNNELNENPNSNKEEDDDQISRKIEEIDKNNRIVKKPLIRTKSVSDQKKKMGLSNYNEEKIEKEINKEEANKENRKSMRSNEKEEPDIEIKKEENKENMKEQDINKKATNISNKLEHSNEKRTFSDGGDYSFRKKEIEKDLPLDATTSNYTNNNALIQDSPVKKNTNFDNTHKTKLSESSKKQIKESNSKNEKLMMSKAISIDEVEQEVEIANFENEGDDKNLLWNIKENKFNLEKFSERDNKFIKSFFNNEMESDFQQKNQNLVQTNCVYSKIENGKAIFISSDDVIFSTPLNFLPKSPLLGNSYKIVVEETERLHNKITKIQNIQKNILYLNNYSRQETD